MLYTFKFRRNPAATWTAQNPVLRDGEPGFERDTFMLKIGDGTTAWNDLPYLGEGMGTDFASIVAAVQATLVDSAPETLDTFNEIAAALSDDENFAATVIGLLADKADSEHTHEGEGGGSTPRGATLVVAATDATTAEKLNADYQCDGTADDVQIQAAITALPSTGGRILCTSGTFTFAEDVTLNKANVLIEGQGTSTIFKWANSLTAPGNMFAIDTDSTGRFGRLFRNIYFHGNRYSGTGTAGALWSDASGQYAVEACAFEYFRSDVIKLGSGRSWVRNCKFYEVAETCINPTTSGLVQGCHFDSIKKAVYSFNSNIKVIGNRIHNASVTTGGAAIEIDGANGVVANNLITSTSSGAAIRLSGGVVQGNDISGGTGIGINVPSSETTVVGNKINGGTVGIDVTASRCVVSGNSIKEPGTHGIRVYGGSNNAILGNFLYACGNPSTGDGIHVDNSSNYNNIQTNTVRKAANTRYGIRVHSSGCTGNMVTNNDLYDSGLTANFSDLGTGTVTTAGNRV